MEVASAAVALLSVAQTKTNHYYNHRRHSLTAVKQQRMVDRGVLLEDTLGTDIVIEVTSVPCMFAVDSHTKIRIIRVFRKSSMQVLAGYVHAADLGGVVERKSNIARLFGKYASPEDKLLTKVVGAHNHTIGQTSNILSVAGVKQFLRCRKMQVSDSTSDGKIRQYRAWIEETLLPIISSQCCTRSARGSSHPPLNDSSPTETTTEGQHERGA